MPTELVISRLCEEAAALHQQGRLSEAGGLYRSILSSWHDHVPSLLSLGIIALQNGRIEESTEWARRALRCEPNSAEAHSNLATALEVSGNHLEAICEYENALALDPDRAEAWYGIASAFSAVARNEEAVAAFKRALAIDPDYAEASCGCAAALQAMKRHEEAIALYRIALAIDRDYTDAIYGLGTALQALKRYSEALACYAQVVATRPDVSGPKVALATVLQALERHAEAIAMYRTAIALAPDDANAHANLGTALQEIGKADEARQCYEKAVAIAPTEPRFRFQLIQSKRVDRNDPHVAALLDLARSADPCPVEDRILLQFAIGKAWSDIGEHEKALLHFREGNALRRAIIAYDEPAALRMLDRIRAVFTPDLIRARRGSNPSNLPVFIVGMPRSGSTLVEQIMASHPEVHAAGEISHFADSLRDYCVDTESQPFPEAVNGLTDRQLRQIAHSYLSRSGKAAPNAQRITDKTPGNFALLGIIHMVLPNARIIHTRRNPVDTCLSCYSKLFADDDQPFTYDLAELGRYYQAYQKTMKHWKNVLPSGVVLDLDYEDLVGDFESQARRIISHCDLAWDEACLSFHKTERPVKTASVLQVRQPIYHDAVGRWKSLEPSSLQPLLNALSDH